MLSLTEKDRLQQNTFGDAICKYRPFCHILKKVEIEKATCPTGIASYYHVYVMAKQTEKNEYTTVDWLMEHPLFTS